MGVGWGARVSGAAGEVCSVEWGRGCFEETKRGAPALERFTDVHAPKMRGAMSPTTSQTPTPAAAPAVSVAVVITTSFSALEDAATTTCSAAQVAANASSRAWVEGVLVGLNLRQDAALPAREGARGLVGGARLRLSGAAGEV